MKNILRLLFLSILINSCSSKVFEKKEAKQLENSIKDSLSNELCMLYGLDQGVRHLQDFNNKTQVIHKVDSINFDKIISFIKVNGYPSSKKLGENYNKFECVELSATAILLHNPKRIIENKQNFDLLVSEYKNGNLTEKNLLNFLDKYYWLKKDSLGNRMLLYGSDFGKPCIIYRELSNEARKEIGLKPLNDSLFNKNCN